MEVARRFGENLRRLRKEAGISQETLGFRCSLHRTEIGLLERGARVPRIDTLIKIAAALGVRIDCALLAGITWESGATTMRTGSFTIASSASSDERADGDGPPRFAIALVSRKRSDETACPTLLILA